MRGTPGGDDWSGDGGTWTAWWLRDGTVVAGMHVNDWDAIDDVRRIVGPSVAFVHGLAHDPKGAELLRGQWGGRLDRSLLIRTARDLAGRLVSRP